MKAYVPVNSPFTLEELVHMIDVLVNSKGLHIQLRIAYRDLGSLLGRSSGKSLKMCLGRLGKPFSRF
jgi:hypothetical protein